MPTASPSPAHKKVTHGLCPICNHYGEDCTGSPAHTPGPWKTDFHGEYIIIYGADGCRIADVYAAPTVDEDEEAVASARLIAAAPTQNDALHAISNDCAAWLKSEINLPADDLIAAIKAAADSAIAIPAA